MFVAEAAAPVASIGNSQYFWWLFMMVAFLLPYGMISSELGTAYPGDGGLYDWIHKAFPETKWGARASWYYWINFPLWMASLAVVCPELLGVLTGLRFGWGARLLIELAFIWVVTWIACYPVCDSILILNISAAIKILLAVTVGVLGIVYVARSGFVNDMAPRTFPAVLPTWTACRISPSSSSTSWALRWCAPTPAAWRPQAADPPGHRCRRHRHRAIYLFSAFGIGAAVPTRDISVDSGLIDAVSLMTGRHRRRAGGHCGPAVSGDAVRQHDLLVHGRPTPPPPTPPSGRYARRVHPAAEGQPDARGLGLAGQRDRSIAVCLLGVAIQAVSPIPPLFWSFFA